MGFQLAPTSVTLNDLYTIA